MFFFQSFQESNYNIESPSVGIKALSWFASAGECRDRRLLPLDRRKWLPDAWSAVAPTPFASGAGPSDQCPQLPDVVEQRVESARFGARQLHRRRTDRSIPVWWTQTSHGDSSIHGRGIFLFAAQLYRPFSFLHFIYLFIFFFFNNELQTLRDTVRHLFDAVGSMRNLQHVSWVITEEILSLVDAKLPLVEGDTILSVSLEELQDLLRRQLPQTSVRVVRLHEYATSRHSLSLNQEDWLYAPLTLLFKKK